jgi:hypothetical protein
VDFFDSDTGVFILVGLAMVLTILVIALVVKLNRPNYSRVKPRQSYINNTTYVTTQSVYYDDPVDDIVTAIVVDEVINDIADNDYYDDNY